MFGSKKDDAADTVQEIKIENRGGKREGAGRKTTKAYTHLSESGFEYVERVLIDNYGEEWKAKEKEKKAITNAVADILEEFDITDFGNPYIALIGASVIYAFGKKRLKPKTAAVKIKDGFCFIMDKWKNRNNESSDI